MGSNSPHELHQTADILVLVKAYPTPSQKYTESVCVAGLRLDTAEPEWIRLYPVQFRLLEKVQQFGKYNVIRVQVRRPTSGDTRPQSFTPNMDTVEKIDQERRSWAAACGPTPGWSRSWGASLRVIVSISRASSRSSAVSCSTRRAIERNASRLPRNSVSRWPWGRVAARRCKSRALVSGRSSLRSGSGL